MNTVTLLTDFGTEDYYVAALKGTLLRLAPGCLPVDLAHDLPPGDLARAGFLLAAAFPTFPAGTVHLAVVDPGVGSERRILAVEIAGSFLVGPDNGLFTPLIEGGRPRAVTRGDLYLDAPGSTFHGRDRFAPVAAYLARGGAPEELGPLIDDPVRLPLARPRRTTGDEGGELTGQVVHIDRYGNLVTNLPAAWLGDGRWRVAVDGDARDGGERATERRIDHYAELADGEAAWLTGSLGTVELSLDGASLAAAWQVEVGAAVRARRCG